MKPDARSWLETALYFECWPTRGSPPSNLGLIMTHPMLFDACPLLLSKELYQRHGTGSPRKEQPREEKKDRYGEGF